MTTAQTLNKSKTWLQLKMNNGFQILLLKTLALSKIGIVRWGGGPGAVALITVIVLVQQVQRGRGNWQVWDSHHPQVPALSPWPTSHRRPSHRVLDHHDPQTTALNRRHSTLAHLCSRGPINRGIGPHVSAIMPPAPVPFVCRPSTPPACSPPISLDPAVSRCAHPVHRLIFQLSDFNLRLVHPGFALCSLTGGSRWLKLGQACGVGCSHCSCVHVFLGLGIWVPRGVSHVMRVSAASVTVFGGWAVESGFFSWFVLFASIRFPFLRFCFMLLGVGRVWVQLMALFLDFLFVLSFSLFLVFDFQSELQGGVACGWWISNRCWVAVRVSTILMHHSPLHCLIYLLVWGTLIVGGNGQWFNLCFPLTANGVAVRFTFWEQVCLAFQKCFSFSFGAPHYFSFPPFAGTIMIRIKRLERELSPRTSCLVVNFVTILSSTLRFILHTVSQVLCTTGNSFKIMACTDFFVWNTDTSEPCAGAAIIMLFSAQTRLRGQSRGLGQIIVQGSCVWGALPHIAWSLLVWNLPSFPGPLSASVVSLLGHAASWCAPLLAVHLPFRDSHTAALLCVRVAEWLWQNPFHAVCIPTPLCIAAWRGLHMVSCCAALMCRRAIRRRWNHNGRRWNRNRRRRQPGIGLTMLAVRTATRYTTISIFPYVGSMAAEPVRILLWVASLPSLVLIAGSRPVLAACQGPVPVSGVVRALPVWRYPVVTVRQVLTCSPLRCFRERKTTSGTAGTVGIFSSPWRTIGGPVNSIPEIFTSHRLWLRTWKLRVMSFTGVIIAGSVCAVICVHRVWCPLIH